MQLVVPSAVMIGDPPPASLRREWGFAPLCGAETTFSGFSKDPSRPLRRELKTTHTTCCAQSCDSCRYDARYQLEDCPPRFFLVHLSLVI